MAGIERRGIVLLRRALAIAPDDTLIMEDLGMALMSVGTRDE
jgi:Flp pilus assembly protein TadD